jgi:hypothetical protein
MLDVIDGEDDSDTIKKLKSMFDSYHTYVDYIVLQTTELQPTLYVVLESNSVTLEKSI